MGREYITSDVLLPEEERVLLIKENQQKRLPDAWKVFYDNLTSAIARANKDKRELLRKRLDHGKRLYDNAKMKVSTLRPGKSSDITFVCITLVVSHVGGC